VRAKVVKNKVAPPFRQTEFDIMFDSGISSVGDLLDLAVDDGIVTKSGAWFNYGQLRLGQGRENCKQFLGQNADLLEEIRGKILSKRGVSSPPEVPDPAVEEAAVAPSSAAKSAKKSKALAGS